AFAVPLPLAAARRRGHHSERPLGRRGMPLAALQRSRPGENPRHAPPGGGGAFGIYRRLGHRRVGGDRCALPGHRRPSGARSEPGGAAPPADGVVRASRPEKFSRQRADRFMNNRWKHHWELRLLALVMAVLVWLYVRLRTP